MRRDWEQTRHLGVPDSPSAGLAQLAPHVPIVSEENTAVPFATRRGYAYSWCVDPLDGTKVLAAASWGEARLLTARPRSSSSATGSSR